jgi:predicted ester cyclase
MSEQIKANLRKFIKELDNGNLNIIDEFFSPDVVIHSPPNPDMNLELYKQFVRGVRGAFPDMQVVVEKIIVEGDKSALLYTAQGTHKGELQGIAPTGKRVIWTGCEVIHWKAGKVIEGWWYADQVGMMQQLGILPTLG